MPFTLAHPAAALPLRGPLGRWGCASALAIGSITPDLAYFVPLGVAGAQSHSLAALFWFCLPTGLVVWAAYLALLRPFARAMLPQAIAQRMSRSAFGGWSPTVVAAAAVSVVVGAGTHLAWDSFTHGHGAAVRALPLLQARIVIASFYQPQVFTLLQHASSAVGLIVLAIVGIRWYRRTVPRHAVEPGTLPAWLRAFMLLVLVLPSLVVGIVVLVSRLDGGDSNFHALQLSIGRAVFSAGSAFLASLVLGALAWQIYVRRQLDG